MVSTRSHLLQLSAGLQQVRDLMLQVPSFAIHSKPAAPQSEHERFTAYRQEERQRAADRWGPVALSTCCAYRLEWMELQRHPASLELEKLKHKHAAVDMAFAPAS